MQLLEKAIDLAVEHIPLYWLVHNAAIATVQISMRMIVANQSQSALPHIIHAIFAMEAHSLLQDPKYLPLRCSLVATACSAYTDLQQNDLAVKLVQHMMKQVTDTEQLLALDPVPQPKAVRDVFTASKDQLVTLTLPLELSRCTKVADMTAQLSVLSTDRKKVVVLLDTLSNMAPRKRVRVWQAALSSPQRVAMEVLRNILLPKATALINVVNSVADREASAAAAQSNVAKADTPAAGGGQPAAGVPAGTNGMHQLVDGTMKIKNMLEMC
jgi:hypothetical protein